MSLRVVGTDHNDFRARVVIPLRDRPAAAIPAGRRPVIDVVVPVHNEEEDLAGGVRRLHAYLAGALPFSARITIADGASTDRTRAIAEQLADELSDVRVLHLNRRGRGRALAAAWLTSDARVVACADAVSSVDLSGLLQLVAPVVSGHSEISVGGRPLLVKVVLGWADPRCALIALRADVARRLVPKVVSRGGLFDAELLVRAGRARLRIHQLPVRPAKPIPAELRVGAQT